MRPLEILMYLACLLPTLWLLLSGTRLAGLWKGFPLLAALTMALHAWFEGPHWQLVPVYLAVFVLLLLMMKPPTRRTRLAGATTLCLLLLGGGLVIALPMFHFSKLTGPYLVGTRTEFLVDSNRMETHPGARQGHREVELQIWYPTDAAATKGAKHAMYRRWRETNLRSTYQAVLAVDAYQDVAIAQGSYPVVVFNHAWRGFGNRSTFIMQELASHGFVVVSVAHPWNAATVELHDGYVADGRDQLDIGNFFSGEVTPLATRVALSEAELAIQTADDEFVLNELANWNARSQSPYEGHLDMKRVGMLGHSFGGATAIEMATQDARVLSALELEGDVFGRAAKVGVAKPVMMIDAESGFVPEKEIRSSSAGNRSLAESELMRHKAIGVTLNKYGGYLVTLHGMDHESFTDKGYFSPIAALSGVGVVPQQRAGEIINQFVVAFFDQTLNGQSQPLLRDDAQPIPEATLQVFPARDAVAGH
jgi:dienelactone hydrolase